MIRINLLPVRAAQKKEQLRSQVVVIVLAVVVTLVACVAVLMTISATVDAARADLAAKQAEIQQLRSILRDVKGLEEDKKNLIAKLDVLTRLKANRTGPVLILDELSKATPEKLWIESFSQDGTSVAIKGMGMNQEVVADFMRRLEASLYYQNVELEVIDQRTVIGRTMESFSIRCWLETPQDNLQGTDKKGAVSK